VSLLHLAPLGSPPESVLEVIEEGLGRILGLTMRRLGGLEVPPSTFDSTRGQWSSTEILKYLVLHLPEDESRLLGLTDRDLFVPVLSFVYGQAQLRGRAALVSLARLAPEFHGLPADPIITAGRALKEAVHEIGHTFGLVHCLDRRCPMSLSVGLADLDHKTADPCPSCSALLEGSLSMRHHPRPDREATGEK
jgi:archaemetzincin